MLNGWITRAAGALALALVVMTMAAPPAMAQARVMVNGEPITDAQVNARVRLFAIEGNNSGVNGAINQLIDEALMMQEARRVGISVSPGQLDEAYQQVARGINVSRERLNEILQQAGANPETLRNRIAAQIAWNGVVQATVAPQVRVSELELDQQAAGQLSPAMSFDYILKEIIFIGQGASGRTAQANTYRQRFSGCDSAVQLSLSFTDAAVVDVGRRHATQLPEAVARELANMNVGGITQPRVTERGVSMLAVCEKTQANDLTFLKEELRQQSGQAEMQAQAQRLLTELRQNARIQRN